MTRERCSACRNVVAMGGEAHECDLNGCMMKSVSNRAQGDGHYNSRILAVDDDTLILDQYRQILSQQPAAPDKAEDKLVGIVEQALQKTPSSVSDEPSFELDCFIRGEEAVAAVQHSLEYAKHYTVAIVDIRMVSGINGVETARQMRVLDPNLQILFVTAYSDVSARELSEDIEGPILWFRKPFHAEEIYQAVYHCCNSWNRECELQRLRYDLASRLELQTQRLETKVKSVMMLQKNALCVFQ